MSPELNLQVTDLLNGLLHLSKQPLKLNDVSELRVDMLVLSVILNDVLLDDVFVSEDGELLLEGGLFLNSDIQLHKRGMNVLHNFEKVKSEGDVDRRRVNELIESVFVKSLYEVIEEDFILMR